MLSGSPQLGYNDYQHIAAPPCLIVNHSRAAFMRPYYALGQERCMAWLCVHLLHHPSTRSLNTLDHMSKLSQSLDFISGSDSQTSATSSACPALDAIQSDRGNPFPLLITRHPRRCPTAHGGAGPVSDSGPLLRGAVLRRGRAPKSVCVSHR